MVKKILFISGTRADVGKMKSLLKEILKYPQEFDLSIFVTGMHMLEKYGHTFHEFEKSGFTNIFPFINQRKEDPMDIVLANTLQGLHRYLAEQSPDLIVLHGDRLEALAGAISGAFNNIRIAHIEGGEISGTIDEAIRHSVTKLSHLHFVANEESKNRVIQLGENPQSVFLIGSPDLDIMKDGQLPATDEVLSHYGIPFRHYAIVAFHPVSTEIDFIREQTSQMMEALKKAEGKYIVINPNNDMGSSIIEEVYSKYADDESFKIFPSLRFEYFLSLLRDAKFIIGNSSAGVREAPYWGVPSINLGSRQARRAQAPTIIDSDLEKNVILEAISKAETMPRHKTNEFGAGKSAQLFVEVLRRQETWEIPSQKVFFDQ